MKSLLKHCSLLIFVSLAFAGSAQVKELKLGDVPSPLILLSAENNVDMFGFPYKNRLLYMRFWLPDSAATATDFNKLRLLYKRNQREQFKMTEGFEVMLVTLNDNIESWQNAIARYKVQALKNYMAQKGRDEYYLRQFHIGELPLGILFDEKGRIHTINPDLKDVEAFVDRYKIPSLKEANNIAAKLAQGDTTLASISDQTLYITNAQKDTIQRVKTDANGIFVVHNVSKEQSITINVPGSAKIDTTRELLLADLEGSLINDFNHTPLGYNLTISRTIINGLAYPYELKSLYFSENLFKSGQNTLTEDVKGKLDRIVALLQQDKALSVEILSHTDCRGSNSANMALSVLRANLCATYIYNHGIQKERINTIGYGETQPLNQCVDGVTCSNEELEMNRRVEFRFYKTKPE